MTDIEPEVNIADIDVRLIESEELAWILSF